MQKWWAILKIYLGLSVPGTQRRDELVRETFDAQVDLLFAESKQQHAGDLLLTPELTESLRKDFRAHMEQHWSEWQEEFRGHSIEQLDDVLMELTDKLDAIGVQQWQQDRAEQNNDMLKALTDAGPVKDTGISAENGFASIPVVEFQPPLRERSLQETQDEKSRSAADRGQDKGMER